jgi:DNA-binding transcriptional MerR regulator
MPYRPGEFAKLIGKSTSTLRRWDKEQIKLEQWKPTA